MSSLGYVHSIVVTNANGLVLFRLYHPQVDADKWELSLNLSLPRSTFQEEPKSGIAVSRSFTFNVFMAYVPSISVCIPCRIHHDRVRSECTPSNYILTYHYWFNSEINTLYLRYTMDFESFSLAVVNMMN